MILASELIKKIGRDQSEEAATSYVQMAEEVTSIQGTDGFPVLVPGEKARAFFKSLYSQQQAYFARKGVQRENTVEFLHLSEESARVLEPRLKNEELVNGRMTVVDVRMADVKALFESIGFAVVPQSDKTTGLLKKDAQGNYSAYSVYMQSNKIE
jgi:hypothetical protein